MKKSILSIICCAFVSFNANAQIPNSGFENWTVAGSYSNPDGWGTMNNTTAIASVYTATKGTPGSPGTAYLKLTSKTVSGAGVVNGIAVSGVLDSVSMTPKSGFQYTTRSANLTGKWQHMIYGTSQGSISVTLTRWDSGTNSRVTVGSGNVTLSGMAMSWAAFTIPITYVDGFNPDTCIIFMKASGSAPTNNDYLWVDNLAFSGVVAGIEKGTSTHNDIVVYPNPASGEMVLNINMKAPQQVFVELSDMRGKTILRNDAGFIQGATKHTVDISGIAAGTYLLRVLSGNDVQVKKIIID